MPRYEYSEGTSNKFWEIELEGESFQVRFGKIGTAGQTSRKSFATAAEAKKEHDKLVLEKTRKGYVLVAAGRGDAPVEEEPGAPAASNPALERAVLADLDGSDPYLAYADWLVREGDPRGQLIQLQARNADDEAAALITRHARHFYGGLADAVGELLTVEWRLGFIRAARIAVGYDADGEVADLLDRLLALPSAKFVQELTIGLTESAQNGENSYAEVIGILVARPPAALRQLFLGDFEYPDETEMSWSHIGNVAPLWKALPQLESLVLQSGSMELGRIDAPALRSFEARTGGFTSANIASVCTAAWPRLERLVVWFGSEQYGAEGGVQDIQPILDGKGLPALAHLGLMNAEFSDDLVRALPGSKILAQIRHLDLSMGTLTDDGARAIGAARTAFAHLERLDLSDNFLSAQGVAMLAQLPGVHLGEQREADEYDGEVYRYVAVGE